MKWRPIPDMPGCFASERGDIRGPEGRIRSQSPSGSGLYMRVTIGDIGFRVNRLVCAAFHGRAPTSKHEAAHRDGKKLNNSARNLFWKTRVENEQDKVQHGTYRRGIRKAGADHRLSKLTEIQRRQVKEATGLQREIAARFGITQPLVSMIKSGLYSWQSF